MRGSFLDADNKSRIKARSVIIASGARYRKPDIPELELYEGISVTYWATPVEAQLCAGMNVVAIVLGTRLAKLLYFSLRKSRVGVRKAPCRSI